MGDMNIYEIIIAIYAGVSVLLGLITAYVIQGLVYKNKYRNAVKNNPDLYTAIIVTKMKHSNASFLGRIFNRVMVFLVSFISITVAWPFILIFS